MIEPLRWREPSTENWDTTYEEPPMAAYQEPPITDEVVEPTPYERMLERLVSFDEMERRPLPAYLVDGTLVEGSLAVIFGNPGGGKSFTALDMAACVATGSWWHGRPVRQGRVLYVAAEGAGGLPKRVAAWKKGNRIHHVTDFDFFPGALNLLDPAQVGALVELCGNRRDALVVIDTVARSMVGGDENSSKDVGMLVAAADRVRRASGGTVGLVHHSGKDLSAGMRGSSALEGAVDTAIECRGAEGYLTLTCRKQKDGPDGWRLDLGLVVVEVTVSGEATTSCYVTSGKNVRTGVLPDGRKADAARTFVRTFGATGASMSEFREVLMSEHEVSRSTAYQLVNDLVREGILGKEGSEARPRLVLVRPQIQDGTES